MNWERWMLERLPYKLRTVRMFTLCIVYAAFVRKLYDEFVTWKSRIRTKMAGTPQVCMLKKVIYDELGINMEIEEGDGKPYDFIVKTSLAYTDKEQQMFALLERYKMAGKSYKYVNSEIDFEYQWEDYVCEQCEFSVEWANYICEQKQKTEIVILVHPYYSADYLKIDVKPLTPLPVDVRIVATAFGGKVDYIDLWVGMTGTWTVASMYKFELSSLSLYKSEDYDYKYILKTDTSI